EVGSDEFSIGFDGYYRDVVHDKKGYSIENVRMWRAGDVVGCLLDVPNRRFRFFLNADEIEFRIEDMHFSKKSYYAAVTLHAFQQCYFNFGQHPFQYPPKRLDVIDFHHCSQELSRQHKQGEQFLISDSILTNVTVA